MLGALAGLNWTRADEARAQADGEPLYVCVWLQPYGVDWGTCVVIDPHP